MRRTLVLLALLVAVAATSVAAQSLTGTVTGRVVDEQGAVLPGVTVTLTGRQGSVPTVTDERGQFRFVGLNPGTYEVRAELSGFAPRREAGLDVSVGRTLTVNFTLRIGGVTETVDVVGNAATIDITSTATDNSLSQDLLQNMPINLGNFNAATALLNYAPGVNSGAGFGGDANYGNSLLIDGVDTRDPEGGSAWVFFNFNIVEEVQVGGIGAAAEYGGFSGAVVNTITKSGGNKYSGLFEARHTNEDLAGKNMKKEYLDKNPDLGGAGFIKKLNDFTVQMGGPFKKDKAFWWFSAQRYAFEQDPTGPRTIQTEVSPRYNGKVTFQITPNDTLIGSFQWDNYNVTGRTGLPGANSSDNMTVNQDSPELVWNTQYRKVFGASTFLEAKMTGYWGYYYLDPIDKTPIRYNLTTGGFYTGGAGYIYYADRSRNQVNVSLSKYADALGKHNFKFGFEFERSQSKSRFEYSDGVYFLDIDAGIPYAAYGYGYVIDGKNRRESYYAQDQWRMGRLTANLGARLDRIRGYSTNDKKTVYEPKLAFGPRLGAAFDVTGKGTTVLKAFWGRYFEGASFNPWQRGTSGYTDFVSYEVLSNNRLVEFDRYAYPVYNVDPDIEHLGVDEWNVALEHQLRRDMWVSLTYMQRDYRNFINSVHPTATWSANTINNPVTNTPLSVWRWVNKTAAERNILITNPDGFQYKDASGNVIGTAEASREYTGLMAVLTKSYSHRWQAQASYVWSKAEGTVNNTGTASVTGRFFEHPAISLVNTFGLMSNDRPHEVKLFFGYQIPKIEVSLNAYYRGLSGTPYTYFTRASGSALNWTFPPIFSSQRAVFLEPRGARRTEFFHQVDLRAEKVFNIDVHRFGVFVDVQNLMNTATITGVQARYPSAPAVLSTFSILPGSPTAVQSARQVTFGGRWTF